MKTTEKHGFNKPENTDFYDVEHQNENWDKVDELLEVVDNLESTRTDLSLSANQGRLLGLALGGLTFKPCTQEYYDSLPTPRPKNNLYIIIPETTE